MKSLILFLFLLTLISSVEFPSFLKQNPKPNIVIIYADDMGYGDLNIQNPNSKIPTPYLDKLASEGIRFTNAHSSSGICTPSRYALLTGNYHWRKFHGIVNSWDASMFDDTELTLPEMLKQKNYKTACIGKWHLGWDWNSIKKDGAEPAHIDPTKKNKHKLHFGPEAFDWDKAIADGPIAHGFDYYFGDDVPNFPPYCWFENDKVINKPNVLHNLTDTLLEGKWEARYGPAVENWDMYEVMPTITQKAVEWIGKQQKEKPFFLYFALTSPHAPIVPNKEWQGKSGAGAYGDYVMQSDWSAGEILKALKKNGFEENTIVIFSSDNGPEHYAYDRVRNFDHRSMGDLRGVKRDVWEGGHRVPFIVKWSGSIQPQSVSDELISQIDLYATLASIVGVELPKKVAQDSFNQTGLFTGKSGSARPSMVHNTFANKFAIQKDNWVFINSNNGEHSKEPAWFQESNGFVQDTLANALFNLNDNINQSKNVILEFPEKAISLKSELENIRKADF